MLYGKVKYIGIYLISAIELVCLAIYLIQTL